MHVFLVNKYLFVYTLLCTTMVQAVIREIDHSVLSKTWYSSDNKYPYKWSILIPSLFDRTELLSHVVHKLQKQIKEHGLEEAIEIVTFIDARTYTVGYKRNALIRQSMGEYIAFVDDDDDVSNTYIIDIYNALKTSPDSVAIKGLHTYQNKKPFYFFQSVQFKLPHFKMLDARDYQWDSIDYQWDFVQSREPLYQVECRRLSHLNPIKRSIALKCLFTCCNMGEDLVYADKIIKSGLVKTEVIVPKICYHYCNNTAHSVGYDPQCNSPRKA